MNIFQGLTARPVHQYVVVVEGKMQEYGGIESLPEEKIGEEGSPDAGDQRFGPVPAYVSHAKYEGRKKQHHHRRRVQLETSAGEITVRGAALPGGMGINEKKGDAYHKHAEYEFLKDTGIGQHEHQFPDLGFRECRGDMDFVAEDTHQ